MVSKSTGRRADCNSLVTHTCVQIHNKSARAYPTSASMSWCIHSSMIFVCHLASHDMHTRVHSLGHSDTGSGNANAARRKHKAWKSVPSSAPTDEPSDPAVGLIHTCCISKKLEGHVLYHVKPHYP
eukprot:1207427-Amphidinium_carterae.1